MKLTRRKIKIDRTDFLSLVAVWEFSDRQWKLLRIERLVKAIALYRQSPAERTLFPTDINLSRVNSSAIQLEPFVIVEPAFSALEISERIGRLISQAPGISTKSIAARLNISCQTARKYLNQLELDQRISRQHSTGNGKSYIYYPAVTQSGITSVGRQHRKFR